MKLMDCVDKLVVKRTIETLDVKITGIEINSAKVRPGDLFIALRGNHVDGHDYVRQAVENGAVAILVEEDIHIEIPTVIVPDTNRAMAMVAAVFYQHPTRDLRLIGVTGTNGKTTTTKMIETILSDAGHDTGLMGTMHMTMGGEEYAVKNTTPNALELQKGFRKMCDVGCSHAVIEVSSHALQQGRTWGSHFQTAVFTNLTQDHLDYHQTMEKYQAAKGLFFSQLPFGHFAVLNADDVASADFIEMTPAQVITYGIECEADVRAKDIEITSKGTTFRLCTFKGNIDIQLQLMGRFNVYNALSAATVALLEGISLDTIRNSMQRIQGVRGRFETIDEGQNFTVIVDYAHTPDSLENVLTTLHEFVKGKIICVAGCGGDRDRTKRPMMARVLAEHSDLALFTSDNPRSEDPDAIVMEMVEGIRDVYSNYQCIVDRKEAIEAAFNRVRPGDAVLIAGKGHEAYQEMGGIRYDFDDREIARAAIRNMNRK